MEALSIPGGTIYTRRICTSLKMLRFEIVEFLLLGSNQTSWDTWWIVLNNFVRPKSKCVLFYYSLKKEIRNDGITSASSVYFENRYFCLYITFAVKWILRATRNKNSILEMKWHHCRNVLSVWWVELKENAFLHSCLSLAKKKLQMVMHNG